MIVKELYCYEREAGKITVSPEKPDCDYTLKFRLIAEEGEELTKDSENFTTCIDVDDTEGWYVKGKATNTASEADYKSALESLGVNFND